MRNPNTDKPIFGGPDDGRRYPDDDDQRNPPKVPNLRPEDPQWVCIASGVLHWDLYFFLGEGQPTPTGGAGGWETEARPRKVSLTNYVGIEPWRLSVPLMIDSWADPVNPPEAVRRKVPPDYYSEIKNGKRRRKMNKKWRRHRDKRHPKTVEQYTGMIIKLAQKDRRTDQPPVVRVYGKALPHWLDGEAFVIEDLTWGARLHGLRGANTVRQSVTLELVEFIDADELRIRKKREGRKGGGGKNGHDSGKQFYVAKAGDNLFKIAAKFYGQREKWRKIAKANDLRGPRSVQPGDRLLIP